MHVITVSQYMSQELRENTFMSVLSDETTRLEIFPPRPGRPFMIHELGVEIVPHVNVRHTEPAVYFDEETTEGMRCVDPLI